MHTNMHFLPGPDRAAVGPVGIPGPLSGASPKGFFAAAPGRESVSLA